MTTSDATRLSSDQLNELRAAAWQDRSPFIDPAAMRTVMSAHFYPEWAAAVLDHPYPGWNHIEPWEMGLLAAALAAEPERPTPARVTAEQEQSRQESDARTQAAAERVAAKNLEWAQLRARLPVAVTVGHNWTIGHWESGYVTGADHIVAQADLAVGRLRRKQYQVFCETPSKATSNKRLQIRNPLRGVDRDDDGQNRIPTCRACLKIAHRIAAPATTSAREN